LMKSYPQSGQTRVAVLTSASQLRQFL